MEAYNGNFVTLPDSIPSDGSADVSDELQKLIDENPNRTIFVPDGMYLISKPLLTPADPKKSVHLLLSNYAIIKAADDWDSSEAMIRLGAKDAANDIFTPGSNYGLSGGVIDASGRAKAVSIDGGRETRITEVSIKNAAVGIHIKYGANAGSSDADIRDVNITGNGRTDSVGLLLEGYDNTATNMRIADVFTGVDVRSGGNMLRNIHPLFIIRPDTYAQYEESVGFRIADPMNWFDYCYSDQFAVGFFTTGGGILKNCFCWWYSAGEEKHIALHPENEFFGSIDTLVIGGAHKADCQNLFTDCGESFKNASLCNIVIAQDGAERRRLY